MTLTDCVVYSVVASGILIWIVCFAVVERHKLAGLPAGVWVALRALLWTALVGAWFAAVIAIVAHAGVFAPALAAGGAEGQPEAAGSFAVLFSGGGVLITICVAIAVTVLSIYLYSCLWQLGAIQPRFTRRPRE